VEFASDLVLSEISVGSSWVAASAGYRFLLSTFSDDDASVE
jgi:hypothetical protein